MNAKHCLHASSTVNANDLSIDPIAVLGSKEANNAGNVYWLTNTIVWRPSACKLINLVVGELLASWDVLAADSVVHVGFDATRSNAVDSDLLFASIWCSVSSGHYETIYGDVPIAMHLVNVSMAPFEPEYTACLGTPFACPVIEPIRMILPPTSILLYASLATKN